MGNIDALPQQERDYGNEFARLYHTVRQEMKAAVAERIKTNPHPTEEEFYLGTFLENIQPQVRSAVRTLRSKKIAVGPFDGFAHATFRGQWLAGHFYLDEETSVRLTALGVQVKSSSGYTRLAFLPEKADLGEITERWNTIADAIPSRTKPIGPESVHAATEFRKKYIAKDPRLQRLRAMEMMRFEVNTQCYQNAQARISRREQEPPTDLELRMGAFLEELEPTVRDALVTCYEKGYTTESSGFHDFFGEHQVIDGDFDIDLATIDKLQSMGVVLKRSKEGSVIRLQFTPERADAEDIRARWKEIASILPS